MFGSELGTFSFWWIVPVVMMIFCFFTLRGRRGTMMRGFGCCDRRWQRTGGTASASDMLDWRYASGEIDKAEYDEKKKALTAPAVADANGSTPSGGPAI